jgi:hypothetical protein
VSADDVTTSKLNPKLFKGRRITNTCPQIVLYLKMSPKGVEAAYNARIPCVVITTMHN